MKVSLLLGALVLVAVTAAISWWLALNHERKREQANIALVLDMWDGVINRADRDAVMKYISEDYIQHNPNVRQGREGVLELISLIKDLPPGMVPPGKKTFKKALAQGDHVVIIWTQPQPDPHNPGETYPGEAFDMFRIEKGQVVEHWDDTRKALRPWRREES
ncbi:MAG: nuclear transport factor 2 family protein [Alphaproteobacteria bacterium]|nr:nuclear transport factor 2 family protein [Alphaproteobacteria bacterium]MBU0793593.1 nuclear transport factor 2 family protein [Alphaproteobacteria bacterium]MBU0875592.1 nuclear transport factor 2 family protein [Alphaproteobacteria bacterium]MBU1771297.1 nuclear transport factor 2 family protein [Alphaproteobacteria bacterium]